MRLGILCPTTCVGLGYGRLAPSRRGFSRHPRITLLSPTRVGSPSRLTPVIKDSHPGFTWRTGCALERTKPSGPPGYHCASPLLTRLPTCTEDPQTPPPQPHHPPKGVGAAELGGWAWVSTRASAWAVLRRYGNINPSSIDYACRPRLRSRLTQGGLAWPWNPWSFGARASHPSIATHACILTPAPSTSSHPQASPGAGRSPTTHDPCHHTHKAYGEGNKRRGSAASAVCLSPATLSAHDHLTSELLRTLSRMAASKPTSWLSARPHILSHLAHA